MMMKLAYPDLLHTSVSLPWACAQGFPSQGSCVQTKANTPKRNLARCPSRVRATLRTLTPPPTPHLPTPPYFWRQVSSLTHFKLPRQSSKRLAELRTLEPPLIPASPGSVFVRTHARTALAVLHPRTDCIHCGSVTPGCTTSHYQSLEASDL